MSDFDSGGTRKSIVPPFGVWRFSAPGAQVVVPDTEEFDLSPHPTDAGVCLIKPLKEETFEQLGCDIATVGQTYSFVAYGDGTASLGAIDVKPGSTIYLPGEQYFGDRNPFGLENSGFWSVESVSRNGQAKLRRIGSGGPGVPKVIQAGKPSDIQLALGFECGSVLEQSVIPGVWPLAIATNRWIGVKTTYEVSEAHNVTFGGLTVVESYIGKCKIQVDRLARVKFDSDGGVVLLPKVPGVDGEKGSLEFTGFVQCLTVENMTKEPMKLFVEYGLGK